MIQKKIPESEKWVTVCILNGDTYAEMVREALDNADIPSTLRRSDMSATFGAHSPSLVTDEVELLVPEEFLDRALEIIEVIVGATDGNDSNA